MNSVAHRSSGELYFGEAKLGDVRRAKRLAQLFDTMVRHPGGTLPIKLSERHDLRAFYRIVNAKEVTHESIMRPHYAATREAIRQTVSEGVVVLIIHDATELDYTNIGALQSGLGQIGEGTHRGYICHNSLAVRADIKEVLGLTSQILHHRADVPKKETAKQCRERKDRESRLWVHGAEQSGPNPLYGLVVDVSDALSDTFEYLSYEIDNDRQFVLRSRDNRRLHAPINDQWYLHDAVRTWRSRDSYTIEICATDKRKARKAVVNIAYGSVIIDPPGKRAGEYEEKPLPMWAVRVWEPNPPEGEEPLEWILLTNVAVHHHVDACVRAEWYSDRGIVEEYHKGKKTGCGIETLQFDKIERLEPTIGVLSILATTLLKLRTAARQPDAETRPATDVVDEIYVDVLRQHYPKRITATTLTVKVFYMLVARLGGHQNRKGDGFPGWITLWRGWMKLESMVLGYRLAQRRAQRCGAK
jgi:hypothetical protein